MLAVMTTTWLDPAAAATAVPVTVMSMADQYPDLARVLIVIGLDKELTAYLNDNKTVYTFLAPTNEAIQNNVQALGKYVGIATQNQTLQATVFNYHVVPGQALTTADLQRLDNITTCANETLWFEHKGNQTYAYSTPYYPVAVGQANIQAGKCIVHPISTAIIPPTVVPLITAWCEEQGTLPPYAPLSEWAPVHTPEQAELVQEALVRIKNNGTNITTAAAAEATPTTNGCDCNATGYQKVCMMTVLVVVWLALPPAATTMQTRSGT
eukprot:GHRR01014264.1.p1 GENE.GHRR01014264.1~~GHRR01014264.1.p1  ORF type:complete len:267 (+),score=42.14 GHRR01014264.1:526-1326(+)